MKEKDLLDLNYIHYFLHKNSLANISPAIIEACEQKLEKKHGDVDRWQTALKQLPKIDNIEMFVSTDRVFLSGDKLEANDKSIGVDLKTTLKKFCPWRKGPFQFLDIQIDTEWDSLLKWQRVKTALDNAEITLQGKHVLDIGCGNGAFMWPMLNDQAKSVTGVEPMWLFYHQFMVFQRYFKNPNACFIPLGVQDLPLKNSFDIVMSMGVLYHRKSPLDHLAQLKGLLKKDGTLILETIVLPDSGKILLTPPDRYAGMRNVWMISSVSVLHDWLIKTGFEILHTSELAKTTLDEQQQSEWMDFFSLNQFLDPENSELTIEGHTAPYRAIIIAKS